jgi:hypothetical protein
MRLKEASGTTWTIPSGGSFVPIDSAGAVILLSAASGLAGALVEANGLRLAVRIAEAYLKMRPDEGVCPISALSRVNTPARSFEGICLADVLNVEVERHQLSIPVNMIRRLRISSQSIWRPRPKASIELVDGSTYRQASLHDRSVDFLTVLGRQSVPLATPNVVISGHTVEEIDELRQHLGTALEWNREALLETVGLKTLERFFGPAA